MLSVCCRVEEVNIRKLSRQRQSEVLEVLHNTALGFKGKDPTLQFIQNLLTKDEQLIVGRRILIAQMILAGKTRADICAEIGISPNTFALTRTWVQQQITNYDSARKTYEKKQAERAKSRQKKKRNAYRDPLSFDGLRDRYPGHFLLFNIAAELFKK